MSFSEKWPLSKKFLRIHVALFPSIPFRTKHRKVSKGTLAQLNKVANSQQHDDSSGPQQSLAGFELSLYVSPLVSWGLRMAIRHES